MSEGKINNKPSLERGNVISSSSNNSSSGSGTSSKTTINLSPGIIPSSTASNTSPLESGTGSSQSSTVSKNLEGYNKQYINFNKLKSSLNLQNNIYKDIFFKTKSHIKINIKDIIGTFKKPKNKKEILNYNEKSGIKFIKFIKKIANLFREFINEKYSIIRELKKQNFANITMYYVDQFEDSLNQYLVYIYYKKTDLYFIYNNNENTTQLYDIGDLDNNNIKSIKSNLNNLNNPPP